MNKKVFTFLLLTVMVLAQFGFASAAAITNTATLTDVPVFSSYDNDVKLKWSVSGITPVTPAYVVIFSRVQDLDADPQPSWGNCQDAGSVATLAAGSGTKTYDLAAYGDQDIVEFRVSVDGLNCAGPAAIPAETKAPHGSTIVDEYYLDGFMANPPKMDPTDPASSFEEQSVACNTFEMWAMASERYDADATESYSGFGSWGQSTTGTFAPPAPVGADYSLLEWPYTLPATATGDWEFSINPKDKAGNDSGMYYFRNTGADAVEDGSDLDECADFTDTAGDPNELYIRYLATLELISGNADGTFAPNNTLTRAEAATLFEQANGRSATDPGFLDNPTVACTFSDVSATDWFAGWVWRACEDGFMNGVGGGMFDPNNTLTRGQVVTIMNNIYDAGMGDVDGYLDPSGSDTVMNDQWYDWGDTYDLLRSAAWADITIGAYYATPVIRAYEIGIVEGTDPTHFSPDAPISRGLFAKWLYRYISSSADDI